MRARSSFLASALATAVVLVAAGCASAAPGGEPTDQPTETTPPVAETTPSATPTEEPPAVDLANPSTWTITHTGIGPIVVGDDFATTVGTLGTAWAPSEQCAWAGFFSAQDDSYGMYLTRDAAVEDGPVTSVAVSSGGAGTVAGAGARTADGLGIGSTKDEILAVHPDATEQTLSIDGTALIVADPDGALPIFFTFPTGADQAFAVTVTTASEPAYEVCG